MATIVYVDGTLQTGNNDGTSWPNAYRGCAGLQTAFNNVVDGADTIIYARHTFDVNAYGLPFNITKAGSLTNNTWLQIIGCDDSGVPYQRWTDYVHLLATNLEYYIFQIYDPSVRNVIIKNFRFHSLQGCISMTSNLSNIICDNCILDVVGVTEETFAVLLGSACYGIRIICCSGTGHGGLILLDSSGEFSVIDSYFRSTYSGGGYVVLGVEVDINLINSILVSDYGGIKIDGTARTLILNNLFYGQNNNGTCLSSSDAQVVVLNNMFYSVASGYVPISRLGGSFYEDFNFTNKASGLSGPNSKHNINPLFVDAGNYDFRLQPASPLLNCGLRTPFGDPGSPPFDLKKFGYSSIAAWQQKQGFISKARIANLGRLSIFR